MKNIIVVIGAGSIGQAIARRVSAGKQVLLADLRGRGCRAPAGGDAGRADQHFGPAAAGIGQAIARRVSVGLLF